MSLDGTPHYRWHPSGIVQHDVARLCSYDIGSALKYAWRLGRKDDLAADAAKCLWHIRAELKQPRPYTGREHPNGPALNVLINRLLRHQDELQAWTTLIWNLLMAELHPGSRVHLEMAASVVEGMAP